MSQAEEQGLEKRGLVWRLGRFIWEITKVVAISLAIVLPVRYFLIQPFFVKGASMEPNFEDGEYLIVDELSYNLGSPERGEVVVFRYPKEPSQYYIKRIIGLPGERIKISGGQITIFNSLHPDGFVLNESDYLYNLSRTPGSIDLMLGAGEYFVLGDNRGASSDSRVFGPVNKDDIIGRAWIRAWPANRITKFDYPSFLQDLK